MGKCTVLDCKGAVLAKGLCGKHYLRRWKYGSPHIVFSPRDYVARGKESTNFKHGHWAHPLYGTWRHMLDRCENHNNPAYRNYGGRGIKVCERWHDIAAFISDMGSRPTAAMLERVNNNGNYEPSNCVWASATAQSRNRRYTKLSEERAEEIRAGKSRGIKRKQLAVMYGVSEATVKKIWSGAYWKIVPAITEAMRKK